MNTASSGRSHPATWLLLVPLPVVLLGFLQYDLGANIRIDYRWLLAGVVAWHVACAGLAHWAGRGRSPHAWWVPGIASLPALVGVLVFAGPLVVASALLLMLVALGLGSLAGTARSAGNDAGATSTSLIVGLAILAASVGWLLPLPVHHRLAYLLLAGVVVVLRRRAIGRQLRHLTTSLRELASTHGQWLVLLSAALTIASLGLWLPSLNYDDNAVHLILPSQLLADGYYHLDVQTQSWAVAPWANNVLHAVAAMLAGGEARPAVALLWLLLGASGAFRLARALDASPGAALAAAAVFASQPLSGYFTTTMQVDGASTAVLLHLAATAVGPARRDAGAFAIGATCGLLIALKTSNLLYMAPLLAWLAAAQTATSRLRWTASVLGMLVLVGGSSYAYAWVVTGNPLFPFYNATFRSPYYPLEDFRDLKWMAGISWRTLWDLSFRTDRYGQFFAGAAGIAMLVLLPAAVVDAVRRPAPRWLLLWALATGLLVFSYMQYLRYIFPALSVTAVLGTVALARFADRRAFAFAAAVVVAANAALMPTTSWIARDNHWAQLLREGPRARGAIVRKVMPERALLERLLLADAGACVLIANPKSPFVGAGHGHAISMHRRYDPVLWDAHNRANADRSGQRWDVVLDDIGASRVIVDPGIEPLLVRTMQAKGYRMIDQQPPQQAWAPPPSGTTGCSSAFARRRDQAARLLGTGQAPP